MMREILFRGKRMDNGQWVEGDLVRLKDGKKSTPHIYGYGEVDPDTVGQYTGLTDKNGRNVFEGDVLEYKGLYDRGKEEIFHAIVFWDEHRWAYKCVYNNRWTEDWNNKWHRCDLYRGVVGKYAKVIGNTHDNPELLDQ